MPNDINPVVFDTRKEVDFVIIGPGASGGVLAKELSTAGFDVVVLEQGPYRIASDFSHDEMKVMIQNEMTEHPLWKDPQTFRQKASEKATVSQSGGPPPACIAVFAWALDAKPMQNHRRERSATGTESESGHRSG